MALENTKTQDNDGRCGGTKNDARATVMLDATAPRTTLGKMTCSCVANAIGLVRVGSGVHKGMRKQCLGSIYSKVVGNRRDFKKSSGSSTVLASQRAEGHVEHSGECISRNGDTSWLHAPRRGRFFTLVPHMR